MPSRSGEGPLERLPNLLVTGTPGTGKSTVASRLCKAFEEAGAPEESPFYINVTDLVKNNSSEFAVDFDQVRDCFVIDEDVVLDYLEPLMQSGKVLLEHHSSEWFPERWFSRVVVLRCTTNQLYQRLEARGYTPAKVQENVQAEIMNICVDEALESYDHSIVSVFENNSERDLEEIVRDLRAWWQVRNVFGDMRQPAVRWDNTGT